VFQLEITTLFIGQLNALQELGLNGCSNLKELRSSIGQLNTLKFFIYKTSLNWKHLEKNTFIYGRIECTQSASFVKAFQLEIITFIYWPIDYIEKSFICQSNPTWNNYFHLLTNWVHSKSFICQGSPIWNYFHLLANWVHSKSFICQSVPTWKK